MLDVPYIIYVVLAVPGSLLGDVLRQNWGFRPDLALICIVALAFSGRGRLAPIFGLVLGLIFDSMNYESVYTYALGFFLVGYSVGHIRARFLRRNWLVRVASMMIITEVFRLYLIIAGSMHAGHLQTPYFHPGYIAPGIFVSLLIFIPLAWTLDRLLPDNRLEGSMRGVFVH